MTGLGVKPIEMASPNYDDRKGAAVDMLIGMIQHNQTGLPAFPHATLIGSTWVDGETCPRRKA